MTSWGGSEKINGVGEGNPLLTGENFVCLKCVIFFPFNLSLIFVLCEDLYYLPMRTKTGEKYQLISYDRHKRRSLVIVYHYYSKSQLWCLRQSWATNILYVVIHHSKQAHLFCDLRRAHFHYQRTLGTEYVISVPFFRHNIFWLGSSLGTLLHVISSLSSHVSCVPLCNLMVKGKMPHYSYYCCHWRYMCVNVYVKVHTDELTVG